MSELTEAEFPLYGGRSVVIAPGTIDTRDFYPKNIRILGFQIARTTHSLTAPQPTCVLRARRVSRARRATPG